MGSNIIAADGQCPPTDPAPPTVLVVDDDPNVLQATARMLADAGYHVLTGTTAAEAAALTRRHLPAMLLLDVMLPDGNGMEVARQLKSEPALAGVFVVLLSGFMTSAEDQAAGLLTGLADGYIARPFSRLEFLARINALLRLRGAQESLRESEKQLRHMTEVVKHAHEPLIVRDLGGVIRAWNHGAEALYGWSAAEVLGQNKRELLRTEGFPADELDRLLESTGRWEGELIQTARDGRRITVESRQTASRTEDGQVLILEINLDITARKEAENEIRDLNQKLETRVLERTNELQAAVTALEVEILTRQQLEREILEISEREQSRLGQDLHDGLGQELSGIAMLGDVLAKQLQTQSHPSAKAADRIATYVRAAIDSTRRLAKGLYPLELERYGLLLALKDLADQTSHHTGIHCELRQCGAVPKFDKSAEIHIYRIVQECIANAVKHGRPRHITIESLAGDGRYTFAVTDDGVGFKKSAASTGMGLHLMDYRARVIGAEITIDQPAQGGCRVTCSISTG